MVDNLDWLGHDVFRISAEKVIYTDPFELSDEAVEADVVLITHSHRDHCSPDDVKKISGPDTTIVATPDCVEKLEGVPCKEILTVKPGDRISAQGVSIEAVRAYNTNKDFHPRKKDWVGYIFAAGGLLFYLAGDTDHIPEMKDYRCDVALLPVSGTYVMTAPEAAAAALDINPKLAVPMHFGSIVGDVSDAEEFASRLTGKVEVAIPVKV